MKGTQRAQSRKSNSWWWDIHISPQNCRWLSENLEEMEKQVKEMLGLIEEEGELSAEKAEAYYQKRPLLITHVENFYRMYRALAERYDSVTGELRRNIPSSLQSHGSFGVSETDSETHSSSFPEPDVQDNNMAQQKQNPGSDCIDVSFGSGVSSDVSKKGSEGSSSSSDSDSELDDAKEGNGSILYALSQKIIELEAELDEAKGAMASAAKQFEAELARRDLEIDHCRNELGSLSEKYLHDNSTLEAELRKLQGVIENLEADLAKVSQENLQLQSRIEDLQQVAHTLECSASDNVRLQEVIRNTQAELEKVSEEKEVLKERASRFEELFRDLEISGREVAKLPETINNLEIQLERAIEEKSILQERVKELEQVMRESLEKHSQERSSLHADLSKLSEANAALEGKLSSVEAELMQVYADKEEESLNSEKQISELNQVLTDLRSKLEVSLSEKATVDDKLANLLTDITSRDERVRKMDEQLDQLQHEHAKLMAESGIARESLSELRARVSELEEEVEKQKLAISESAEGKREAIRQLCFSIEHYRSGYQQLRQLLQGHRGPLVMAT